MTTSSKLTWILVANRAGARIYGSHGRHEPLLLLAEIDNPRGRMKAGEIDADRPGRSFDRMGEARHAMSSEESPTERVDQEFAAQLAERLEQGRLQGQTDALVLVAGPKLLGRLRDALPAPTRKIVAAELDKDLINPTPDELREHLSGLVAV